MPTFPSPADADIAALTAKFEKVATVTFAGHTMVFQRPTYEHGLMFRRQRDADDPARMDNLALFTIVAFDDRVLPEPKDREPLRVAFKDLLRQYPLMCDAAEFQQALASLLGLTDVTEGKGFSVSSATLGT